MNLAGITDWPGWGFWGIPIGVFVGAAGFWAARRYGDSGRRLFYWIDGTTGLVRKISHGIEVTHNGKPLKDPVLSKLVLEAPNRRDINEGDYSKARPLTFVFDRPVVAILDSQYLPKDCPPPELCITDHQLAIGPDPLHAGARLSVSLLFEGRPSVETPVRTLADVKLISGEPRRMPLVPWWIFPFGAVFSAVLALIPIMAPYKHGSSVLGTTIAAAILGGLTTYLTYLLAFALRTRQQRKDDLARVEPREAPGA
jgi:hypothetical protein